MKKFLVLSAVVGLAGIGVGVARQQGGHPASADETAIEATTSTTIAPAPAAIAPTSPTTVQKVAAKPAAAKGTTTTRPAAPSAALSTTTTTARAATTTTTTQPAAPTCTLTADYPSVKYQKTQRIRFASNMPGAQATMTIRYSPTKTDTVTSGASSTGQIIWTFINETGRATVAVSADVQPTGGQMLTSLCSTTYQSLALSD